MKIYTPIGEMEQEVKSVADIIEVFDLMTDKPFFVDHIHMNFQIFGADYPNKINESDFVFESLAFRLTEYQNTEAWGTLFGPISHIPLLDGTYQDNPNIDEITPDAIAYWESRYNAVSNPIIKLQYMGLVYSFKKKITNNECDNAFLESYVRTIVDASQNGWELPIHSACCHLPLAMGIARNLPHLLPIVKAEFTRLSNDTKDSYVAVWSAYFQYMTQHLADKIFDKAEKETLVSLMEKRLANLLAKNPETVGEDKLNPFDIKHIACCLAQYYKQNNMKTEKERVVCSIETGFRKIIEHGNPMQQLQWIIEIQKCYFTFGMTAKAQSLYPEIQAKGVEVKNCLFPQTYQFSIPKNVIQALESEIICGTTDEIYSHFVDKFTLKKSSAEEFVKKQAQNPLTGMVGTLILSESGMPLSEIGTPEYDKEGNEYAFGAKLIEHEECVMRHIVEILLNNQIFSKDLIVKHIMVSGLIHSDRISVIEKGVELYLNVSSTNCN